MSSEEEFEYSSVPKPRHLVLEVMSVAAPRALPVPLLYELDLTWAERLRKRFQLLGHKISFTAILIKAISIAQRQHPITRTYSLPLGGLVTPRKITAGFTVEREIDGTPTVLFGTIENSDAKSIIEIANELHAYGKNPTASIPQLELQVRSLKFPSFIRKLMMHLCIWFPKVRAKLIPATFGISSVGKWGCKTGQPPSIASTVFGVGEIEERSQVINGKTESRPMVSVTYVFDHLIIDGGPACRFMKDVQELLEGGLEPYVLDELDGLALAPTNQLKRSA